MDPEDVERRLAAILSADVAGYSRLMAADEAATVRTISAYREEIGVLIRQNGGRLVDFTGDNFLAEFNSAVHALDCAVEVQRVIEARNANLDPARRMQFRIGAHVGDVRVEGERIYGDGINVAARLQALAEPGGICVSETVREQTRGRLGLGFEDLGAQEVKNIPEPVRVHRVRVDGEARAASRQPRRRGVAVAGLAVLLAVVAGAVAGWRWLGADRGTGEDAPTPSELTVPGFSGRPAIAVLAFDNLSDDPEQEYFADGIAEDLISRLSAWRRLPVIARNSSFVYKGSAVDVKQVSRELGVRYVVEGSVRRAGNKVRITAQLIDATTGHHVWAQTYDREMNDIFALQDEISLAIASAINPEIQSWEWQRAARVEPQSLDAWDRVQQGWWYLTRLTAIDNARARELFLSATDLDPMLAPAWTGLAWTHYNDLFFWLRTEQQSGREMLRAAQRAVALDPQDPLALLARAAASGMRGDLEAMRADTSRALEQNPSEPMAHYWTAVVLTGSGRPDEAISQLELAMRLSPRDPWFFLFLESTGSAHFSAGRYAKAVEWTERSLRRRPDYAYGQVTRAASYAQLGRLEEARSAVRVLLAAQPHTTLTSIRASYAFERSDFVDRLIEGLRLAGLED
ncbi:MAG: adenylate/guanylate cyclase domain-containing protein [Deltaproteobacteria bacterium]|nr:adenylate/guanylate cyclase domain-containing protein [Deltaproteobacteria bacterium]MBW2415717.1 adenylate/guanylate cyclase domain-containing protein [Deltaproteobacteria bacterium]